MHRFEATSIRGVKVRVAYDDTKLLFNLIDIAEAAGFAKASSLRYHTQGKKREVLLEDGIYLTVKSLSKVAKDATKTPHMILVAEWAKNLQNQYIADQNAICEALDRIQKEAPVATKATVKVRPNVVYSLSEVAQLVGMKTKELNDWLVAEGYADRYASNNNLYLKDWFKKQGYGQLKDVGDGSGRKSNVPRITNFGLSFIQNRIESQRESNVLSFAAKESNEREKMEKTVDELILDAFKDLKLKTVYADAFSPAHDEYKVATFQLLSRVKGIIAQVKLKDKE